MKREFNLDSSVYALFPQDLHPGLKAGVDLWRDVYEVIEYADKALLYGPPGTGKSSAGAKHAMMPGQKLERFAITNETSWAQLSMFYLPGPEGPVKVTGSCVRSWLTPNCRAVVDELKEAGGDTVPGLHMWLDDVNIAQMTLMDGTTIKPADGFKVIATMNGDPALELPEALLDRFAIRRFVDRPDPHILMSLPAQIRVAAGYSMFNKAGCDTTLRSLTTRSWIAIGRMMDAKGATLEQAVRLVTGPHNAAGAAKAIKVAAAKVGATVESQPSM